MSVNYGNLSFSPLEPYTKIITRYVDTIKNILSTVSDLGFSARGGNVSQSTIFRGTFRFLGGHYIYIFFILMYHVLCYQQMQCSRVN